MTPRAPSSVTNLRRTGGPGSRWSAESRRSSVRPGSSGWTWSTSSSRTSTTASLALRRSGAARRLRRHRPAPATGPGVARGVPVPGGRVAVRARAAAGGADQRGARPRRRVRRDRGTAAGQVADAPAPRRVGHQPGGLRGRPDREQDVREFVEAHGLPIIVKPIRESGSLGVFRGPRPRPTWTSSPNGSERSTTGIGPTGTCPAESSTSSSWRSTWTARRSAWRP